MRHKPRPAADAVGRARRIDDAIGRYVAFCKQTFPGDRTLEGMRLVVDTGMHSKGWTRDQALEFMAANTALSTLEIRTETDRYISWPGQALAYKMGELKIRELLLTIAGQTAPGDGT